MTFKIKEQREKREAIVTYKRINGYQRFKSLSEDIVEDSPKRDLDPSKILKTE